MSKHVITFRAKGAVWTLAIYGNRNHNPLFWIGWSRTYGYAGALRPPFTRRLYSFGGRAALDPQKQERKVPDGS